MRKIILFMMITLDGYIEGENHNLSWHNVDSEFNKFANDQLDEADSLVFGHRTYELMADFWPSGEAMKVASATATRMNTMQKIVFTRQSFRPQWNPTTVSMDPNLLRELRQISGKPLLVLGSSNLSVSLLKENLLDELRIMINPVAIGKGTPFLDGLESPINFDLVDTRRFQNGNVLLRYKTAAAKET